jgi:hypothetical protein
VRRHRDLHAHAANCAIETNRANNANCAIKTNCANNAIKRRLPLGGQVDGRTSGTGVRRAVQHFDRMAVEDAHHACGIPRDCAPSAELALPCFRLRRLTPGGARQRQRHLREQHCCGHPLRPGRWEPRVPRDPRNTRRNRELLSRDSGVQRGPVASVSRPSVRRSTAATIRAIRRARRITRPPMLGSCRTEVP